MDSRIIVACLMAISGIIILILGVLLFRRASIRKNLRRLGRLNMVIEKCPFCGSVYPVRDDIERCPRCGGDLKHSRSVVAQNEKKISIDGKDDTGIS